MNTKLKELKEIVKEKAATIKALKLETKEYQRKCGGSCGGRQWKLQILKRDYRMHHIAYSMLLGRTHEQIEGKKYPPFNPAEVAQIKERYTHEDVCADAA